MFFPTFYYDSAYGIPYGRLYEEGKRAVLFDLDNTLVEHGAPASEEALKLMEELRNLGYGILFLSNAKEPRVKMFNEKIGAKYIFRAHKPSPKKYLEACEMLGTTPVETIFVGDQIFTDIVGANRAGMDSYMVKKVAFHEEIQIYAKRILEFPFLLAFRLFRKDRCVVTKTRTLG